MNNNEETINLKDFLIYVMKKWRVLIIAMFVGALLLGIYKGKFSSQAIPLSTTQQQDIQDQIDENNDSISDYTATIKQNKDKIIDNNDTIKTYQAELEVQKEFVSDLEGIINTYSKVGTQAADNLVNANIQLNAAKKKVSVYETHIEDIQQENAEIPKTNASLQENIYKLKKDNRELKESLSSIQFIQPGISSIIKYAIFGVFLGAFIICGIAFTKYVLYTNLRNADELRVKYNLRVIGNLYVIPQKKKHNKIDILLNKWSGFKYEIDSEKQYKLISAAIQVLSADQKGKIILTGTIDEMLINQVSDKLKTFLPDNGCTLCTVPNPVYDGDALLNIKESTVILIEAKDISNKREINKLIDLMHAAKAELIGAVLV